MVIVATFVYSGTDVVALCSDRLVAATQATGATPTDAAIANMLMRASVRTKMRCAAFAVVAACALAPVASKMLLDTG